MRRIAGLLMAFSAACVGPALAQSVPTPQPLSARAFSAEGDAILKSAWAPREPGGVAIVTKGGEIMYSGAQGLANLQTHRPVTIDTVFRLGSITKQFVAALILKLVEQGQFSLDDPLRKFVPDYPEPGGRATIRQLLNHTSGIKSYTFLPGWEAEANISRARTTQQLIAEFRDLPNDFGPGADFAYDNSGYVLLAAVIETVTGKPWHVALKERITDPLGLESIRYGAEEDAIADRALPYSADPNGVRPAPQFDMSTASGAGGLIGSARDLARWADALHHGKILSAASYAQMTAPTVLPDGRMVPYGFGLSFEVLRGMKTITHGGAIAGAQTDSVYLPDQDIFVAAFVATDAPTTHPAVVARQLVALAAGRPIPLLGKVPVEPTSLEPLFGVYETTEEAIEQQLYFGGGHFRWLAGGRERIVHFAGNGRFLFAPPYELDWFEIKRDASGANVLEMHDSIIDQVRRSVRKGVIPSRTVPRATLERYVGRYKVAGTITTIALGPESTLTVQRANQPDATPLRTVSPTQFAADKVGALLTFEGDGPKAPRLRSRLGEMELLGERVLEDAVPDHD